MKNLKNFLELITKTLKVLMINTIIFSLVQIPFVSKTFAAGNNTTKGFEAKDILNLANGALGIYGSYLSTKQQILQQQVNAANNQKLISQLSPTCTKSDGTACYTTPAKIFPECTLPASMSNMPTNACTNPTPEVNQISSMITYESIAQGWMNYYDQMSNEASNSSYAVGLSCLNGKQKAMDSQLTEMVNSLQRLQDRMNQDKQIFRDNNKKLLADMDTANDELFGGGKTNLKIKTQDFAKFFSQSCQSVIGKDNLKSGTANGLNGILQGLSSNNKAAADFNLNKNVIEDDVRREANKILTSINTGGVDDFLTNGNTQTNIKSANYPTIEAAVKKQAAEFTTARARINKELALVGYTPPAMDKNFAVDMNDFMAGSEDFFRKKYVNDCVTGADQGIAIPVEDILKSLEQKSTQNAGTARNDYRAALKKILDSDSMMDDKMVSIKDLQNRYPDITITYKNESQSKVTESPYNLFMKTIDKCQQRYAQGDQFSSKGSSGVSYQKKVERGRAALQELKNLNDSFSSKVTQAITEKVLNCDGEASKAGSDCSEETLKTTSDNFCVAHASICANSIQGCYAEANTQVQTRKTKMENLAKKFNANVASMITSSNALYEQQKIAVTNITKLIQSKFPGTNFEIPKDMFVAMPALSKDAYGVEMAENGDLKSILDGENSMPNKIEKLKQMFKDQKTAVKTATTEYIDLQKQAMTRERARWDTLYNSCKGAIDSSSKALAKTNQDGQKNQGEQDLLVKKYCNKYSDLKNNPNGGCDKAKALVETWGKIEDKGIEGRITGNAHGLAVEYDSVCQSLNNETSAGEECKYIEDKREKENCNIRESNRLAAAKGNSSQKATTIDPSDICPDKNTDDTKLIANALKSFSPADREKLKDAKDLSDLMDKLEKGGVDDHKFFSKLKSFAGDEKGGKLCERILNKITAGKEGIDTPKATAEDAQLRANKAVTTADQRVSDADERLEDAKTAVTKVASLPDSTEKTGKVKVAASEFDAATSELKAAKKGQSKAVKLAADAKLDVDKIDKGIANSDTSKGNDKAQLDKILSILATLGAPQDASTSDGKYAKLTSIGERMDESCDAQNNSSMAKGNTGGFDLNSFDKGILGISK